MDILEETSFDEIEILKELNLCFKGIPGKYYPAVREQDIKYNFLILNTVTVKLQEIIFIFMRMQKGGRSFLKKAVTKIAAARLKSR